MAESLPSAQAVFIPKAGHLSNLEAPLAFNDALNAFLSKL
jgi:pimeloyl-ACP methyl ester carboxylesterase